MGKYTSNSQIPRVDIADQNRTPKRSSETLHGQGVAGGIVKGFRVQITNALRESFDWKKFNAVKCKRLLRALKKLVPHWTKEGSHVKFTGLNGRVFIIPDHREQDIPRLTIQKLVQQLDIDPQVLWDAL